MRHTLLLHSHFFSYIIMMKTEISWFSVGESLISTLMYGYCGWDWDDFHWILSYNSRFVHMNENEWMNRMEMKLRMGRRGKSLSESGEKLFPLLHIPHVFVFRLCFTLNYGFIQTYIHSWWTMNFSFFPLSSSSHFRGRMSRLKMCVVCFSKISPRGFNISYSK